MRLSEVGFGYVSLGRLRASGGRSAPPITDTVGSWTVTEWLRLAAPYGAASISQDFVPITGATGWLKYLGKHASRGVAHYHRQGKSAGWESTGRLWGKGGVWPVGEPVHGVMDVPTFRRLRRMIRAYTVAQARADLLASAPGSTAHAAARRRLTWARHMLRCSDPGLSAVLDSRAGFRVRSSSRWRLRLGGPGK